MVTILCYHTFDSAVKTPYTVTHERFNEQMRYLWIQHIPVISLDRLNDYLHGKGDLPERSVVVTIDDGYKTAAAIAWPILKRYHFPATLYIYPYAISHLRGNMRWDEVRALSKDGADIESHALTHPLLTHPGKPMDKKEYQAWLDGELVDSKRQIEFQLGHPISSIAYPYGGYSEYVVERTKAAGYATATTCDDGDVASFTNPLTLNRRLVFRQTTVKAFTKYFDALPIQLSDQSPRDGERVKQIPKEIRAKVVNVQQIDPASAQILVDKVGGHWRPVAVDPKTGEVIFPIPTATRTGYYFVSLSAKDKLNPTLQRGTTWIFIVKRNASKK